MATPPNEWRAALESRLPEMLADLERLVRCESPSADLTAVRRSAELIAEIGTGRLGSVPDRVEIDGCSHLRWRFGKGPNRIIVLAHHDTVWPIGSLLTHPWSNETGVVRGPGTVDMKAGLVQAIHALGVLIERGAPLDGLVLLVTGDEEIGSVTSRWLIEDEARGCEACFVLEGAGPRGSLKTGRKGTSLYRIEVTGRAAHAGAEPEKGVNSSVELAHLILAVSTLGDPALGTSVTPTVAGAGTTTNTVPAAAFLNVDVRARTAVEQQRVDLAVRAITPTLPGSVLTVLGGINRPPMEVSSGAELFERAVRLGRRDGLGEFTQSSVGGASDGNFTAGIGVPTLDGFGAIGGGAHADSEHALVTSLVPRSALLVALIRDLLDPTAPSAQSAPSTQSAQSAQSTLSTRSESPS